MAIKGKKIIATLTMAAMIGSLMPVTNAVAADTTGVNKTYSLTEIINSADMGNVIAGKISKDEAVLLGSAAENKATEITMADYELVAESDSYKMYLYAPRLSIILENKTTGELIESTLADAKDDGTSNDAWKAYMKSGVVIQAIQGTTNTYQVDLVSCENTIDVTKTDNGFSAKIFFKDWQFGLTVNVTLEGDDLVVNVPDESIVENGRDKYISTISLFPFMNYSYLDDEEGYMLIPDGNGALIYLDDKEGRYTTGFSQMIYGKDAGFSDSSTEVLLWEEIDMVTSANKVLAPVFGVAHTERGQGYVAIVEKGEERASIEVQPNGVMVNYNRCFAKFLLRDVYIQPLNNSNSGTVKRVEDDRIHSDLQVRYCLLSGDSASYSGMAVEYRNYLLDNGLTAKDTSYNTRVDFLGTDREKFLMGTKAVTVTTVDNIEEIFAELQELGVDSVLSVYKGWQKGGIYNFPISKYKADSHIGGTGSLTKLIKSSEEKNYDVYLYNDALRINPETNSAVFNVVKKVNKRTFKDEFYANVYDTFLYQTTAKTSSVLNKFVKSYTKKGVDNLALTGITENLFSSSNKGSYFTRFDCAKAYEEIVKKADENTDLILEQPFAYLWNYTDAFLDMPLGSSDYMYTDEEVPFLSMVLKGIVPMYSDYVNFEANKTELFLQMVESGVYPSFYITYENSSALIYTNSSDLYSTEYSTYKDTIVEYDEELRQVAEAVSGAIIVKHEKLDNGVTVVTYDNGVVVYVNYSEKEQSVGNVVIPAMSYKVG